MEYLVSHRTRPSTAPHEATHRLLIPNARKTVQSFGVTYSSPPGRCVSAEPGGTFFRKGERAGQTVGQLAAQATRYVTQGMRGELVLRGQLPFRTFGMRHVRNQKECQGVVAPSGSVPLVPVRNSAGLFAHRIVTGQAILIRALLH